MHQDPDLGSLREHGRESWAAPADPGAGDSAGRAVLADAVRTVQEAIPHRLVAAYALGSLAHGGFSPLVSDVDLALILSDPIRPTDAAMLLRSAERVRATGSPLHSRLSVFWGTADSLAGRASGGRFPPLDRLCLLEHGRLLAGTDARAGLAPPERDELLVGGAEFALVYLAGEPVAQVRRPELLLDTGMRWATKVVLFPVRFLFTAETRREGTNDAAAARYLARPGGPGAELVDAALDWRSNPPDPADACELLRAGLLPLYLHYIDDHVGRLTAAGHEELAQAFTNWRTRLTS